MRYCVNCGAFIEGRGNRAVRCISCQEQNKKVIRIRLDRKRLGSPKLYRRTTSGRLIPENYGCGNNVNGVFPKKQPSWMKWEEEKVEPIASSNDTIQNTIEVIKVKTRKEIYKEWKY